MGVSNNQFRLPLWYVIGRETDEYPNEEAARKAAFAQCQPGETITIAKAYSVVHIEVPKPVETKVSQ